MTNKRVLSQDQHHEGGALFGMIFLETKENIIKNNAWFLKHRLEVNIMASCVFWGAADCKRQHVIYGVQA